MNRIIFIILIPLIILAFLIVLFSFFIPKKPADKAPLPVNIFNPAPTSQPVSQLPATPLSITQVIPADNSADIPSDQQVQIIFNRPLNLNEVYISFGPGVIFKTAVQNNTIVLIPNPSLTSGLTYRLLVKFNKTGELSKQYQFTVLGTPPSVLPDTQPPGAAQQSEEFNRQNHPDIFLVNKTPLKGEQFDLYKGTLKLTPQEHYSFIAVSKTGQAVSTDGISAALIQLGLNQSQINSLDITSISKAQFDQVLKLKDQPPYYSSTFSLLYERSSDKTTAYLDQNKREAAQQDFNNYLKQNGIGSADWINNLSVVYQ